MTDAVKQPNTRTRVIHIGAEIKKQWGAEWSRPDVAYEFSNGRKFDSTDSSESGIYSRD